jgi:hypothetical protein
MVKSFITKAMGASDRDAAKNSCHLDGMDAACFNDIEAATLRRFPKLELYIGWGLYTQNFEGVVLRDVMLQGARQGIVALPAHDAVAVQQQYADWARDAMIRSWKSALSTVIEARVAVDYP